MDPFMVYLMIGAVMMALGLVLRRRNQSGAGKCTALVAGTVTEVRVETDEEDEARLWYIPVYAYTVNGKDYAHPVGVKVEKDDIYAVGQQAWLLYNPKDPGEAVLKGTSGANGGFGTTLVILGAVLVLLAFSQGR